MTRAVPLAAALWAVLAIPAFAQDAVKVIEVRYVNAEELIPAVKVALSPRGKVAAAKGANALIVNDSPESIRRAEEIVAQLDRRPANVRVTVEFIERAALDRLAANLGWRIAGGGWSMGTLPPGFDNQLRGELSAAASSRDVRSRQSLLLMEGKPGRIFVGDEIPVTGAVIQYGYARGFIAQNTEFKRAGTSFSVTVRRAGDGRLAVDLAPEISSHDRGAQTFTVAAASTSLIVDDPGSVALAGDDGSEESFTVNFLRGAEKTASSSRLAMILSVRTER